MWIIVCAMEGFCHLMNVLNIADDDFRCIECDKDLFHTTGDVWFIMYEIFGDPSGRYHHFHRPTGVRCMNFCCSIEHVYAATMTIPCAGGATVFFYKKIFDSDEYRKEYRETRRFIKQ